MMGSGHLTTPLELRARTYAAPARRCWLTPFSGAESVTGWLVEASDGRRSGWWGPVEERTAALAVSILAAVEETAPATPPQWAERMRRAVRHSHAGIGAVAIGAAELAAWDLVGQREGAPVWALGGHGEPVASPVYVTCFGLEPESAEARELSRRLRTPRRDEGPVQKWDAAVAPASFAALAEAAGGLDRLAVDMKGRFDFDDARRYCDRLPEGLCWIEEPLPPWRIHRAPELGLTSPLAAGEHCYGVGEVGGLRAAGVTVFQPDAVFCGGFGALSEIASALNAPAERLAPHGGGLLPALHLAAKGARVDMVEWHLRLEPRRLAHLALALEPREDFQIEAPAAPGWAGPLAAEVRLS